MARLIGDRVLESLDSLLASWLMTVTFHSLSVS